MAEIALSSLAVIENNQLTNSNRFRFVSTWKRLNSLRRREIYFNWNENVVKTEIKSWRSDSNKMRILVKRIKNVDLDFIRRKKYPKKILSCWKSTRLAHSFDFLQDKNSTSRRIVIVAQPSRMIFQWCHTLASIWCGVKWFRKYEWEKEERSHHRWAEKLDNLERDVCFVQKPKLIPSSVTYIFLCFWFHDW